MYNVMQANLRRSKLATDEYLWEAQKRGVGFGLIQEPYVGAIGRVKDYVGTRIVQKITPTIPGKPIKAAIVVLDQNIRILADPTLSSENIAHAILSTDKWEIEVMSVYFEEDQALLPYMDHIRRILGKSKTKYIVIGGDINAWSPWWGSVVENDRGAELAAFFNEMNLHILNLGDIPTFETIRRGKVYKSRVDVTICSEDMIPKIDNWKVDETVSSSDHNALTFTISLAKPTNLSEIKTTRIYNTKKAKWSEFEAVLTRKLKEEKANKQTIEEVETKEELESKIQTYINIVKQTSEETIPKLKRKTSFKIPWWTEELEIKKKDVTTKKRRIRCAAPNRRKHVVQQYLEAKEIYEEEAKNEQTRSWKEFCTTQDRETMWDGIYRVIRKTAKRQEDTLLSKDGITLYPTESAELLVNTFYPDDREEEDQEIHRRMRKEAKEEDRTVHEQKDDPPFTEEEVRNVLESLNPKKAPGPDGLTADICAKAIDTDVGLFLGMANRCLYLGLFPREWKIASVVVLRKPGKSDFTHPKSYRPIGLLSVFGKIFEKMLIKRIRWHILPKCNPRQYGFVPQSSTEDSLYDLVNHIRNEIRLKKITIVVSLDIEGAFDNAWWPTIKNQLRKKGCPYNLRKIINSYFEDRKVIVNYAGATATKRNTKGCIQGSIGGPTFWNILLDPLLDQLEGSGTYCQAFADDIVLVFSGRCVSEMQENINQTLDSVQDWGIKNKLNFAAHKTNGMIITKKLKFDDPIMSMGGKTINIVDEIKLLGLTIDKKLTFNSHISNICKKSSGIYNQLSRAAKVSWGLNSEIIRTIYVAVIEPIVLYAASVWYEAAEKIMVKKQLDSIQRGFAQRVCRSYRTVSLTAALLLSGLLPLDLRILEAAYLFEVKRGRPIDRFVADRELETRISFTKACHPVKMHRIEFKCIEDWTTETIEKNRIEGLMVFTDGSKIEGKVGAALSWWRDGTEVKSKKLSLESFCTVFQAEMYALYIATEQAKSMSDSKVTVFSDSRSSLELIQNYETFHPLAFAIRRNISNLQKAGKQIELYWVKAHVGVDGNERADELAKAAALTLKTAPDYDRCPISFVKRSMRRESLRVWQKRYEESETAKITKLFFPHVEAAYKTIRKINVDKILAQIFTGHGGFSQYLHRFKLKASPECICDAEKDESIIHLIVECPVYMYKREMLKIEFKRDINQQTLYEWIVDEESRYKFLKFCEFVTLESIERNKT